MLHNYSLHNKVNGLHKHCLLIIYSDKISILEELFLEKGTSVSLQNRNIQTFATKLNTVANIISLDMVNKLLQLREESLITYFVHLSL